MTNNRPKSTARAGCVNYDGRQRPALPLTPFPLGADGAVIASRPVAMPRPSDWAPKLFADAYANHASEEAIAAIGCARVLSVVRTRAPFYMESEISKEERDRYMRMDAVRSMSDLVMREEGLMKWKPRTRDDEERSNLREHYARRGVRRGEAYSMSMFSQDGDIHESAEIVVMSREDYNKLCAAVARLSDIAKRKDE